MEAEQPLVTTKESASPNKQWRRARSRGMLIGFVMGLVVLTSFQALFWSMGTGCESLTLPSEGFVASPSNNALHQHGNLRDGANQTQTQPTSSLPGEPTSTQSLQTTETPTVKSEAPVVTTELPPVKFTNPKPPYKEISWPLTCPAGRKGTEQPVLRTDKPHILVGVLARNREPYQERFAQALNYSLHRHPEWKRYVHVRVYDDASDEVSADRTKQRFSMAERFILLGQRTGLRGGGITETFQHDCASTDYDICIVADSDTLLHPDWIPVLVRNMNKTDGQVTLYNSCSHQLENCKDELCEKHSVGGALNVVTRKLLLEINCNVRMAPGNNPSFDFIWGDYIKWTGRKMYTVTPSMGEHLGIYGASNGVGSQNEQSRDFNLFDLPQPLSSLVYTHLESRMNSVCNKKKLEKPPGWELQAPALSEKEKPYFILSPRR